MVVCPEINHGELIPRKVSTATARWICFRTPRKIKEAGYSLQWTGVRMLPLAGSWPQSPHKM